jgi:4-amino-4-deoxy-L-arabinose transferase-like glycosyltransferase
MKHHYRLNEFANRLAWGFVFGLWIGVRLLIPVQPITHTGTQPIFDTIWSIGFVILIGLLAYALGSSIIDRWLPLQDEDHFLKTIISLGVGLGTLAFVVSGLGILQVLSVASISALIIILSILVGTRLSACSLALIDGLRKIPACWSTGSLTARIVAALAVIVALLALLNAAVPAWDYDGLMYHLTGPREYLRNGGIYPDEQIWYVNGPFSIELLFTLGLAFGDVLVPKLIHLLFGAVYVLSVLVYARRWFGKSSAWIAMALMLGMPTLPIWAGFAYIDLAWSLFEWMALAAAIEYIRDHKQVSLDISAIFIGFALSAKYLALMGIPVIGALLLWDARHRFRELLPVAVRFGSIAGTIAGMWYLKNIIWFGNPVYPLYFGGPGWSPERLRLYNDYLHSFGTGPSVLALLSMPVTIFSKHELFGAVMNRNDILNPLFLLIGLIPFTRFDRLSRILAAAAGARFLLWFSGSQQIRFLLPIDPAFAILAAFVILDLQGRFRRRSALRSFLPALSIGLILITVFYQIQLMRTLKPWKILSGSESPAEFLERNVGDFGASHYMKNELAAPARVLLLGDGRSYYCSPTCIPDPDHFRWAAKISGFREFDDFQGWAASNKITHLLFSIEDADFLLQHDPNGIMREALTKLASWHDQGCLEEIFTDTWTRIFEIGCNLSNS